MFSPGGAEETNAMSVAAELPSSPGRACGDKVRAMINPFVGHDGLVDNRDGEMGQSVFKADLEFDWELRLSFCRDPGLGCILSPSLPSFSGCGQTV